MTKNNLKIAVAVTGASGAIYAKLLLDKLQEHSEQVKEVSVVMSNNAEKVWQHELENTDYKKYPFRFFDKMDFNAPIASGSSRYDALVICPCSMGTMGRIASGISNDLTTRAADVMLKERRKLILVARETPLNLIQINNMKTVTESGGIICPATPSFYSKPTTVEEVAMTVVSRVLDLLTVVNKSYRWNETI